MNVVGRSLCVLFLLTTTASAEPLPFRRAIELAVRHSNTMAQATAEQIRARAAYLEAHNMYVPQMTVGSGLAATFGFPLSIEGSAPSVLNLGVQSFLLNPAQREFVRAAKTEWDAAAFNTEDRRQQVILDTATAYIQLDRAGTAVSLLRQQLAAAAKAEQITDERVQAGVDSQLENTKAKLNSARVRLRLAEMQGMADVLRTQLAQLTGMPPAQIETVTESIPALPQVNQDADLAQHAAEASPAVRLAESMARVREQRAKGEHKQLYPVVDFIGQYGLFAKYNNYDEFFRTFQRHNGTVGVAIRFPFLNLSQRAHAQAADAEAAKARKQAEDARDQVSTETLKLQRAVEQLSAAAEVARLEHELAQADVDTVQTRLQAGQATLRDAENARLAESDKYAAFLDASYQLEKTQMQLLRATGELEKWALR